MAQEAEIDHPNIAIAANVAASNLTPKRRQGRAARSEEVVDPNICRRVTGET
jgi:hypothetical protein